MVIDISERETPKSRTRDIHILSCAFLVFLAYGAAQNLETTVNAVKSIKLRSLTLFFLWVLARKLGNGDSWNTVCIFCGFLVVCIIGGLSTGVKECSVLGTTGYWLFIAANLKPTCFNNMGWGARSYARDADLHEGTVIGQFNGEFWAMFALHQEGSTSGNRTLLFIVFLCSMTLGTILMCFLHKVVDKEEKVSEDSSVRFCSAVTSTLKSVITPLLNLRMLLIIPLVAYSVLQQSFVWADYTKDVVNPILGEAGVGGAMAVYGALYAIRVLGKVYPLLMAALLGIGDGVLNMQLSALHVLLSKHDMEEAFTQPKVW
ncbi:hypothetical protein ES319_D04G138100v1 [Gossypium barbadense]|uniref:UNC93-like protein 3 n=1 Tax=Gossypium barbadense TaxID=3634 RepID=A0A5J5S2S9_GOSBA|nr:hypothetical protein ES319_D04G138100v1 [Gossypium barbadense]